MAAADAAVVSTVTDEKAVVVPIPPPKLTSRPLRSR
jgi:hypothetical protein